MSETLKIKAHIKPKITTVHNEYRPDEDPDSDLSEPEPEYEYEYSDYSRPSSELEFKCIHCGSERLIYIMAQSRDCGYTATSMRGKRGYLCVDIDGLCDSDGVSMMFCMNCARPQVVGPLPIASIEYDWVKVANDYLTKPFTVDQGIETRFEFAFIDDDDSILMMWKQGVGLRRKQGTMTRPLSKKQFDRMFESSMELKDKNRMLIDFNVTAFFRVPGEPRKQVCMNFPKPWAGGSITYNGEYYILVMSGSCG
jgi:hypothetical protein